MALRWLDPSDKIFLPPMTDLALARAAEQARPNDLGVRFRVAEALIRCEQFGEAGASLWIIARPFAAS